MGTEIVHLDDDADRWKWVCPRGHRDWEPTNDHFWCATCARSLEHDAVFHQLHNRATGRTYGRDQIELQTTAGSYRDAHSEGSA